MKEELLTMVKRSLCFLPDKVYIRLYYRLRTGRKLNTENPETFNEKIQWMKFHYRFPLQCVVSDKLLVRDYVREKAGEEYLIPLLGKWDTFDEIDFQALPKQFVLKCNHDSGGLVVCRDKAKLDYKKAKRKIEKSLKSNFYTIGREYQYKNIKPKILCEKFISENGEVPMDYKIYCFNGRADIMLVCRNRFSHGSHKAEYLFYDQNWNYLRLLKGDRTKKDPGIPKPENLDEMLAVAEKLSADFIYARIDLYNIKGKIYFGEITLSPNSGFYSELTEETDKMLGDKIKIPYWDVIDRSI